MWQFVWVSNAKDVLVKSEEFYVTLGSNLWKHFYIQCICNSILVLRSDIPIYGGNGLVFPCTEFQILLYELTFCTSFDMIFCAEIN